MILVNSIFKRPPIFAGNYKLKFIYPTYSSWHSFLKWKYEDGHLVHLALGQVLTANGATVSLAQMSTTSETQKWTFDYNGNLTISNEN